MSLSAWLDCCGSVYANFTSSVTWSLFRGSSTGDALSTNVIPRREGRGREGREGGGEEEDGKERGRKKGRDSKCITVEPL